MNEHGGLVTLGCMCIVHMSYFDFAFTFTAYACTILLLLLFALFVGSALGKFSFLQHIEIRQLHDAEIYHSHSLWQPSNSLCVALHPMFVVVWCVQLVFKMAYKICWIKDV